MVGGEGDENSEENKREVVFRKQNRKEDETKLNKEGDENNDENDKKNCFLKQNKRKLMATNY